MQQPQSSAMKVVRLVDNLVKMLVPKLTTNERRMSSVSQYILQILGSSISPSTSLITENAIEQSIKHSFINTDRHADAVKLNALFIQFHASRAIQDTETRAGLLYVLKALQGAGNDPSMVFAFQTPALSRQLVVAKSHQPLQTPSLLSRTPSPALPDGSSDATKPVKQTTGQQIAEEVLIRDIVYVLQGIDGEYIKFDDKENKYIIESKGIPRSVRTELGRLSEVGWLFRKLREYTEGSFDKTDKIGLIEQSFREAVQGEIRTYYRMLAQLEAELKAGNTAPANRLTLRRLIVWSQEPAKRLRWLAVIVQINEIGPYELPAPHKRLAQLSVVDHHGDPFVASMARKLVLSAIKPVLNMIENWAFQGQLIDPFEEFFVVKNKAIAEKRRVDEVGRATRFDANYWEWTQQYLLLNERVPPSISHKLANKILVIGKTINFMRQCCGESEWVAEKVGKMAKSYQSATLENLKGPIGEVAAETNARLLKLIVDKYKVMEHCDAVQKYMFLGQGDFVDLLLDLLGEEMDKPQDQFHKHNLVSILDSAIRSSCMHSFPEYILDCLDINKVAEERHHHQRPLLSGSNASVPETTLKSNWELVELTYRIPSPLDAAFGSDAVTAKRRKIFRYLWRLKRVQHVLSKTWRSITSASRQLRSVPEIRSALHTSQMLSNEMVHFIYNIQYYIMFEVLESSWKQFTENSSQAKSLDDLIQAHDTYLDSIIAGAFLTDEIEQPAPGAAPFTPRTKDTKAAQLRKAGAINSQISQILSIILEFSDVFGRLYAMSLEISNRRAAEARGAAWASPEDNDEAEGEFAQDLVENVQTPLNEISVKYRKYFAVLHRALRISTAPSASSVQAAGGGQRVVADPKATVDEYLSHLAFRLDFSSFYKQHVV